MLTHSQMLDKMLTLAVNAHAGQFDKSGQPYILHPLKVMHYLKTTDTELQCIAIGHDLLEDTHVTDVILADIGFTKRIITGIHCMTKFSNQSYNDYVAQVLSSRDAMLVKLCDLRHNSDIRRLKGVTQKDLDRINRYQVFYTKIQEQLNKGT